MKERRIKITTIVAGMLLFVASVQSQITIGDDLEHINYSKPKKYEIGGITVTGVRYLDNSALVMLSGLSVGDLIDVPGIEISKAIKNLWKQGLFENVTITATKIQDDLIFLNNTFRPGHIHF